MTLVDTQTVDELRTRDEIGRFLPGNGRIAKYTNPEEMQEVIDRYFEDCKRNHVYYVLDKKGAEEPKDTVTDDARPTVTGLALALGFNGRQSLLNYEGRDAFLDTIKRAKARVESYLEQRLYDPSAAGAIFSLKNNYAWRDEKRNEHILVVVERTDKPQGLLIEADNNQALTHES